MGSHSIGVPAGGAEKDAGGKRRLAAPERTLKRRLHENGLGIVAVLLFVIVLLGQSVAGHKAYNQEQRDHGRPEVTFAKYLSTGHFGEATFENWESEFLQMGMYVFLTALLVQKGSAESKKPRGEEGAGEEAVDEDPRAHRTDPDAPWPVRRGGVALKLYEHSLSIAFLLLFVASFVGHAVTGAAAFNEEQAAHGGEPVSVLGYISEPHFWFESLQNWQSEFLAVVGIVVLSIFLRQRGSPESKPVHRPHSETGTS